MMMKHYSHSLVLLFATTALSLLLLVTEIADAAVTVCPKLGSIEEGKKYHADSQCDRAQYNRFKCSLGRHKTYQSYKALGGISNIANQKTVVCPAGGAKVDMQTNAMNEPITTGMDTVWFVENAASTPIVVSYVMNNGMEVSAKNPKISPAIQDPNAILQPGHWMAVYAFEGHEFVVREVLKTGVAGNVLLQHRAGLIPIGMYSDGLECPDHDIEPIVNETRAPQYQRTTPQKFRPCNTMDIGFRNVADCPLHGYYVHGEGETCQETFKFHLGVESQDLNDYMWDWTSQTKYEGTFIGHTFHFRLAANPAVLVDTVTLAPVLVRDCPSSKVSVPISVQGDALLTNIGRSEQQRWSNPYSNSSDYSNLLGANVTMTSSGGFSSSSSSYHTM